MMEHDLLTWLCPLKILYYVQVDANTGNRSTSVHPRFLGGFVLLDLQFSA